ncbi:MAG: divalent-cation tolerance protein CutA [Bacteroidia bacterium]|nr:divalent-cation tolerance protein CutA [Bacteroidia bacterium]
MRYSLVYITTKDREEAKVIGKLLLQSRLVACINVIDSMTSMYWWKGKIEEEHEAILIAKTKAGLVNDVIEKVKSVHSYDTPCIVSFPILTGNKQYLDWIKEETVSQ